MGIVINKITFKNYRQYGTGTMSFSASDEKLLNIFIAQNGTGKTTILNAITWCLYKEEKHLSEYKKPLPIITSAVMNNANVGDIIPVEVSITITDVDSVIEFKRTENFTIRKDSLNNKKVISGTDQLIVTTTKIGTLANTEIKSGPDAEMIVKQYFDKDIFKLYFFDGEKLREFFSQTELIQQSIFNISQVTMLQNSCDRLKKIKSDKTRLLAKDSPDIAKLNEEQKEQENSRSVAQTTYNYNKELSDKLSSELDKLDESLREYGPVKSLQEEREKLISTFQKVEEEFKNFKTRRTAFIRKYMVLLSLYPRIKRTLEIIKEKESAGDLPPAIDKDLIKKLLDHPEQHCPICNSSIDDTAIKHMQNLLDQFSVSSKTSNYLKEIKGALESSIDDVKQFKLRLDELNQTEMDITARKERLQARLSEITSALSNFGNIDGQINVSKIESRRSEIISAINNANQAIGAAKITIKNCDAVLDRIEEKRSTALKKMDEHEEILKQVAVIEMLYKNFEKIKTSIISDMKDEIETTTWNYFNRMIWKKNTFGSIKISDSYDISVYNKEKVEMTGSLSATEQMALAYAFTLAIHQASGKNCPLVIDSPLGRVSDTNRTNMAEALKDVSKEKQIILLFTPVEYSDDVKEIFKGTAVIKQLTLSEDENYVEGIDR